MDKTDQLISRVASSENPRKSYQQPSVQRVDLALEETMSAGCKLADDTVCVGPPITAFSAGS